MKLPNKGGRYVVKRGKPVLDVRTEPPASETSPKKPAESKPATSEDET